MKTSTILLNLDMFIYDMLSKVCEGLLKFDVLLSNKDLVANFSRYPSACGLDPRDHYFF
jgi:hypothetical protein